MSGDAFYEDAKRYWEKTPATVNGMLGGFAYISDDDIEGSKEFLLSCHRSFGEFELGHVLDCGSGIGRVTKHLLLPLFKTVDMVDVNKGFIDQAGEYIGADISRVRQRFVSGLQDFDIPRNTYNVIWCQWVLGHLKDSHLSKFFQHCIDGLKPGGLICVKENISNSDDADFDDEDSSFTRPRSTFLQIFQQNDLEVLKDEVQDNFPPGLFEVRMFALKPRVKQ